MIILPIVIIKNNKYFYYDQLIVYKDKFVHLFKYFRLYKDYLFFIQTIVPSYILLFKIIYCYIIIYSTIL